MPVAYYRWSDRLTAGCILMAERILCAADGQ